MAYSPVSLLVLLPCYIWCSFACTPSSDTDPVFRSVAWVKSKVDANEVVLLDARGSGAERISGATSATWQDFAQGSPRDANGGLVKESAEVKEGLRERGVSASKPVVVYGDWNNGWGEEGRLQWMLKWLGHRNAFIMDGGFQAFASEFPGLITSEQNPPPAAAVWQDSDLTPAQEIRATKTGIQSDAPFLVDVRKKEEYDGSLDKPHGVSRSGHAAGAVSFPFGELFGSTCLKSCSSITTRLKSLGWTEGSKIAAYCTGGIRSGFFWAVLTHCGMQGQEISNYDGSMWEWAADSSLQMETDAASSACASVYNRNQAILLLTLLISLCSRSTWWS